MYLVRNTFECAMGKVNRLSKNEQGLLLKECFHSSYSPWLSKEE